jgi:glycosyltransferase involved in cell wall biosynthesis
MSTATVLHLIETSGPGGAEKLLLSLVAHLDASRYWSVACLLKRGWLSDQLAAQGVETIIVPQNGRLDTRWLRRVIEVIRRYGVNVLHAHEFAMNTYGSLVATITGVPIVTTIHGKNYYADKWRRRLAYRLVSRLSYMVAVSADIKRHLAEKVGVREDRVITIPNGIDLSAYDSQRSHREEVRRTLGVDNGTLLLGAIGNLYPVKGHTYLLRAVALLHGGGLPVKLVIAGRGALLDDLRAETTRLGIARDVAFLGFREDVPALLPALDVFVLPSLSEGLPLSALEAMATGMPVVATRVGGAPEVVAHGESGLLVPPADPTALAEAVRVVLCDREVARRFAETGRRIVETRFSLARMLGQYEALYTRAARTQ